MRPLVAVCTALVLAICGPASAERRVALVIGIEAYAHLSDLANPENDALALAGLLSGLGFEVTPVLRADLRRLDRALSAFAEDARGADLAVVYFAGHGMEVNGQNLLLPADADTTSAAALAASALPLDRVAALVAGAAARGLILIDACRNDPFAAPPPATADAAAGNAAAVAGDDPDPLRAGRPLTAPPGVAPGFGRVGRAEGLIFAFAAAPGRIASDGPAGGHAPFTEALLRHLPLPGVDVRTALSLAQQDVYDRRRGAQLPYVESGLPGPLFLSAPGGENLSERERLLLAMAGLTPALRAEVERTAAARDMPLAPLFAAAISADLGAAPAEDRARLLAEAAEAYAAQQARMASLAAVDPRVADLRERARAALDLGTIDTARELLAEAVAIDEAARGDLLSSWAARTLSAAESHALAAGAALSDLRRDLARADLDRAVALYAEAEAATAASGGLPPQGRAGLARTLGERARLSVFEGRLDQATADLRRAVALAGRPDPSETDAALLLVQLRFDTGRLWLQHRAPLTAAGWFHRAAVLAEAAARASRTAQPGGGGLLEWAADALAHAADAEASGWRFDAALATAEAEVALRREIAAGPAAGRPERLALASALDRLARRHKDAGSAGRHYFRSWSEAMTILAAESDGWEQDRLWQRTLVLGKLRNCDAFAEGSSWLMAGWCLRDLRRNAEDYASADPSDAEAQWILFTIYHRMGSWAGGDAAMLERAIAVLDAMAAAGQLSGAGHEWRVATVAALERLRAGGEPLP